MENVLIEKKETQENITRQEKLYKEPKLSYMKGISRITLLRNITNLFVYKKSIIYDIRNKKDEQYHLLLKTVGNNIRAVRKLKYLTIDQLAQMANLSSKYLQGVEIGKRNISITNLNKIAVALETSLSILFNKEMEKVTKLSKVVSNLENYSVEEIAYIENAIDNLNKIIDQKTSKKYNKKNN